MFKSVFQWLLALLLLIPAVLLLAFGPRQNQQVPTDRVVVEYWEKWTGEEEVGVRAVVDDFNNTVGREKGIFVRYLSTSSVDRKTLVACAAGVPPDIAGLWEPNIAQFAAENALLPLDQFAAEHHIDEHTYKPAFWKECHYNSTLYALVSTGYDVALYYNKRLFRAAGLDPNHPPTTIAELDADAKRLDRIDPDGRVRCAGYMPMEPGWFINWTPIWFGGNWWDPAKQQFRFTDPAVLDAFRWVQSYSNKLGRQAVGDFQSSTGNYESPQNAFIAQTVAMEQQGTYFARFMPQYTNWTTDDWGVAPFPAADPNVHDVTYCTADVLVIPRAAKHPREAFEFMAYLNTQGPQEKLADLHCKVSALATVSESFLAHHRNPYIRIFERLAASPNAYGSPPLPIQSAVVDEMKNFTDSLALLRTTPERGLSVVQTKATSLLNDFQQREQRAAAAELH